VASGWDAISDGLDEGVGVSNGLKMKKKRNPSKFNPSLFHRNNTPCPNAQLS